MHQKCPRKFTKSVHENSWKVSMRIRPFCPWKFAFYVRYSATPMHWCKNWKKILRRMLSQNYFPSNVNNKIYAIHCTYTRSIHTCNCIETTMLVYLSFFDRSRFLLRNQKITNIFCLTFTDFHMGCQEVPKSESKK